MADYRVEGAQKLYKLARDLRIAGRVDLRKELNAGLSRAVKPIGQEVRAEIPRVMPTRYAGVLSKALSVRISNRTSGDNVSVRVVVSAKGRREKRKLPDLNAGVLRHPVFGRERMTKQGPKKNPWSVQRIRPGFVSRPAAKLQDQVTAEAVRAIERVADKLARG